LLVIGSRFSIGSAQLLTTDNREPKTSGQGTSGHGAHDSREPQGGFEPRALSVAEVSVPFTTGRERAGGTNWQRCLCQRSNRGLHHPAGLQSVVCDVRRYERQKPISDGWIQGTPVRSRYRPNPAATAFSNWEFVSSRAFHLRRSESAMTLKLTQVGGGGKRRN